MKDHLGSTRTIVNTSGSAVSYFDYYPFGKLMGSRYTTSNDDRYKFTGHELDTEAGLDLSYAGARYLDSEIGGWLSIDPLADQYPGWSPYNYTMGNPMNLVDPDGEAATSCCYAQGIARSDQKAYERGGTQAVYENMQRRGKESVGFLVGVAAVASVAVPGPEDVAVGVFMASKAGQTLGRIGGRVGSVVSGLFKKGDNVIADNANVVRGGLNKAENFENGTGVIVNDKGLLDGVSVNSKNNLSIEELSSGIPNGKIGTTTVGNVRKAGGDVIPSPNKKNPNHATLKGITSKKAEELMNPIRENPSKNKN